jgi:16S rRNA G966 N2-methylase RsmD
MSSFDAADVISQLPKNVILLDPFCGTGTILYEAQIRGLNAIGVDNNPLACIIARGKTEPLKPQETIAHIEKSIERAKSLTKPPRMSQNPSRYFHPKTQEQIMRLIALSDDFSSFELSALYGSICVAARACNGWIWTSTSIGRINSPLRSVDFYSTFLKKAKKHVIYVKGTPPVRIFNHDARRIHNILPENSIDIVYSSPPYFDSLDYTGYYSRLVLEILNEDRAKIRAGLIQRYSSYKEDMIAALRSIDKVLKDNALVILIVGDRMVHQELIKGFEFFTNIAPWKNPYVVERGYTNTPSGLWDKVNTTNRKEQVIVWDL